MPPPSSRRLWPRRATGFNETVQVVSGAVREDPANTKPAFPMDPVARFVPENTLGYKYVGDPVKARDADGDTLSYSLDGPDESSFYIAGSTVELDDDRAPTPFPTVMIGRMQARSG